MQVEQPDLDSERAAPPAQAGGPDDPLVREQEDAAAAEAARIGGRSGMEGMEEAERAAAEHGGGEAKGFEQAEEVLEEHATHAEPGVDPLRHAGEPELESDRAGVAYGEPDLVDSTETEIDTEGTHPEDD